MKHRRAITWAVVAIILITAIGMVAAARRGSITTIDDEIPVGKVKRGDLNLEIDATGELRANHTITLRNHARTSSQLWLDSVVPLGQSFVALQSE